MKNLTASEQMIITKYDLYFESRVRKLEANEISIRNDMGEIKSDLRWVIGIMLGGFGSMFALMAHGFKWL